MAIKIAVPAETTPGETRVGMTPDAVRRLTSDDVGFIVQKGAGLSASFRDEEYTDVGAEIGVDAGSVLGAADVVLKVQPPSLEEADLIREGTVLISFLTPHESTELIQRLAARRVTALSLELVPRITRAQSMDALSSMSTLAGYKAAVIGADSLGKVFPLLMTAAGTLSPAHVLVLGAGVAGLQAIATAKRLGGAVEGYDIRPAVKEQVESLGAKFVEWTEDELAEMGVTVVSEEERETSGGYAKQLAEEEQARERDLVARHVAKSDVVITTALIPGKPAPLLITTAMVEAMRPGSVVVDLAAPAGGNCELTRPDEVVDHGGVLIHGPTNLPADMPVHASQMFARNLTSLLKEVLSDGELAVDMENDVVGPCCVTHAGEVRFSQ
jgi:NAD(P) transhydrogenase subunit alpha